MPDEEQSRRQHRTAREIMDRLSKDPAFIERMKQVDRRKESAMEDYRESLNPLTEALKRAGITIDQDIGFRRSLLTAEADTYTRAIPILLKWLPKISNIRVKEDIVRALAVPGIDARVARALLDEFHTLDPSAGSLRWAIGNTIEVIARDEVFGEIEKIATDERLGSARQMFVAALGNMQAERATDLLIDLLDVEEVLPHALLGLQKRAPRRAEPHVRRLSDHPNPEIREQALKALKAIENASER